MLVTVTLDDGQTITYDKAERVYERDERCLYIYDGRNAVLAIIEKAKVVRLLTDAREASFSEPR